MNLMGHARGTGGTNPQLTCGWRSSGSDPSVKKTRSVWREKTVTLCGGVSQKANTTQVNSRTPESEQASGRQIYAVHYWGLWHLFPGRSINIDSLKARIGESRQGRCLGAQVSCDASEQTIPSGKPCTALERPWDSSRAIRGFLQMAGSKGSRPEEHRVVHRGTDLSLEIKSPLGSEFLGARISVLWPPVNIPKPEKATEPPR